MKSQNLSTKTKNSNRTESINQHLPNGITMRLLEKYKPSKGLNTTSKRITRAKTQSIN